jgi:hypothetical protein
MKKIYDGELLIAEIGYANNIKEGKTFSDNPLSPLQYGLFRLPKETILQRHIHKVRPRLSEHKTLEFLYVVKGLVMASFYSLSRILICTHILETGDFVMLYDGGHGFDILKDDTVLIEVKSGQYQGDAQDKDKF